VIGSRLALQTRCLAQSLKQALHTASRLGYDGVQIDARTELPAGELSDTGLRELRKLLNDLNLRVSSVAYPTRRGLADPADLQRRIEATMAAMRMGSRLGAGVIVVPTGPLPGVDSPQRSVLVESLEALAAWGSRQGVTLALASPDSAPGDVAELLGALPEGLAGADLNPADLIRRGRSPRQFASELRGRIVHVYANDAVSGGGDGVEVELGRGLADVPELLGALEEGDYRGWLTVQRRNSTRTVDEAADAIAYLRAL